MTLDNLPDPVETPSLLNVKSVAFLLPVALFIFALSFVPLPAELASYNPLTSTTARLVVLGTIVLGILSGLGAVNAAWGTFSRKTYVYDSCDRRKPYNITFWKKGCPLCHFH